MAKQEIKPGLNEVIVQKWEESERGWGTRPDGFSLHLTFTGLRRYIEDYWAKMPDQAPDEYSRPAGTPYPATVGDEVIRQIEAAGGGLRYSESYEYPGSGGFDGWVPLE